MSVRPKIMKLARMIGGLPGMLNKLDENSPEYYCLDCVVTDEMADVVDAYKYGIIGEVLGGVLVPTADAKLVAVENGKLKDVLPTTDSLMQVIAERLPKPANPTA